MKEEEKKKPQNNNKNNQQNKNINGNKNKKPENHAKPNNNKNNTKQYNNTNKNKSNTQHASKNNNIVKHDKETQNKKVEQTKNTTTVKEEKKPEVANKKIEGTKKANNTKKETKKKDKKDKKPNKFITTIKKKWLINGTKTFILVVAIIAIFVAINQIMKNLQLTPLDFSQEKLYTLSDETKDKVKDINKDVKIYFVGSDDTDSNLDLAKQFKNVNEHIQAEAVNINDRPDLATKYGIQSGTQEIVVESDKNSKMLATSDLTTYDTSSNATISVAEEKLTSAILSVTSEKTPKVYFLSGYSNFSLSSGLSYLQVYLSNEVTQAATLDLISTGKIPDDCDTLVITTPSKDFDDIATNAIIDYINSGRNILWFNAALATQQDFTNVNKILALYGVNPFELGIIRETDSSKMASNQPDIIIPQIEYSKVTKDLYNSKGVLFVNATKINMSDESNLSTQKITKTDLVKASSSSYFRTNFSNQNQSASADETKGEFLIGAELDKTIKDKNEETGEAAKVSKMIIYGENYFISDYPLSSSSQYGLIQYAYNKDLAINSISYLVDREEDITVRKNTGTVTYTATEEQNAIIQGVIFAVPVAIIFAGIIVWQVRRRRK